jgi:hypothetical protein
MRPLASLGAALLLAACGTAGAKLAPTAVPPSGPLTASAKAVRQSSPPSMSPLGYRTLPIAALRPGTADPRVTPATIATTICVTGWSEKVRPPTSVTDPIKTAQIAAYGYDHASKSLFELDHLIPLEIGEGPADVANLWAEPYDGP